MGFSTGALALSDVGRALEMLAGSGATAVELSALRLHEVGPLLAMAKGLDLSAYPYVSVHAPSRFSAQDEPRVVDAMVELAGRGWPIVIHPDTIHDVSAWRRLGALAVIENMDKRKPIGRTVEELGRFFEALPEATFCLDLGHARQVDRTMSEAYFLASGLGQRLRQLHVSEVNTQSRHDPLSWGSALAFRKVARLIPDGVPLILETPAKQGGIARQVEMAVEALGGVAAR
ncbi:MAG: hypothetical protein IT372_38895 [Polyangiaceae bacterium]|nr:hypothetical protein [Polyangiaceae bacterium]